MVIRSRENKREAREYSQTFLGQEDVRVKQEYYSSQATQNKTIAIQRRTDAIRKSTYLLGNFMVIFPEIQSLTDSHGILSFICFSL